MKRTLFLFAFFFALSLSARQVVRFKENLGTGFMGMYNPSSGLYVGPSFEFGYSPVLLNVNNSAFLMADVVGRVSGTKNVNAGAVGLSADLEMRVYNKRVNHARYGLSVSYGWNCAVGKMGEGAFVPVWGFDWVRTGLIFCDKGIAARKQKEYYIEFQEWEGQYFVGFGVDFYMVQIAPRLHSRMTYFTGAIKMRKYK